MIRELRGAHISGSLDGMMRNAQGVFSYSEGSDEVNGGNL